MLGGFRPPLYPMNHGLDRLLALFDLARWTEVSLVEAFNEAVEALKRLRVSVAGGEMSEQARIRTQLQKV